MKNKLTFLQLMTEVAAVSGFTRAATERVTKSLFEVISENLVAGTDVKIPGFGTFRAAVFSGRKGVNPRTGETIQIPARKVARLRSSSKLRKMINA